MKPVTFFWIAFATWAVVFAAAFLVPWSMEATGDGFARGLNRVGAFFGFQLAAAVIALAVWLFGNRFAAGNAIRWLSRAPAALFGLLVVGILALIVGTNLSKPDPAPLPGPATAPAAPAQPVPE
mgnify:CR=1 FL=1